MLLVSIVDDTLKDATALKRCVEEYCKRNELAAIIRVFRGGMDFFNSGVDYHEIIFIDVQMKTIDGLETARSLRMGDQETILIIVTETAQFEMKEDELDILDTILKPVSLASVTLVMDKALKCLGGGGSAIP